MRKNTICGWISTDDCADFYAADFGWEVKRWFHNIRLSIKINNKMY
jgi:hypothetical protein